MESRQYALLNDVERTDDVWWGLWERSAAALLHQLSISPSRLFVYGTERTKRPDTLCISLFQTFDAIASSIQIKLYNRTILRHEHITVIAVVGFNIE